MQKLIFTKQAGLDPVTISDWQAEQVSQHNGQWLKITDEKTGAILYNGKKSNIDRIEPIQSKLGKVMRYLCDYWESHQIREPFMRCWCREDYKVEPNLWYDYLTIVLGHNHKDEPTKQERDDWTGYAIDRSKAELRSFAKEKIKIALAEQEEKNAKIIDNLPNYETL